MELYVDESGQTGCIKYSNSDKLSFVNQPIFANGALIIRDANDKKSIVEKYLAFKNKFSFEREIKGSDLLTRKNNEALDYFIDNILNDENFAVNLYDKRFYIATLLCLAILDDELRFDNPISYYEIASILASQKDEFYIEYLKFVENINEETAMQYFGFLHDYCYIGNVELWTCTVSKIIDDNLVVEYMEYFMTYTWYEENDKINVINLNCLSELIFFVKEKENVENSNLLVIHDRIDEFEETIKKELNVFNVNVDFEKENNIFLEIADNVVSIFTHAFNKMKKNLLEGTVFKEENGWDMSLVSKLVNKIGMNNIKYTISLQDWASMLAIKDMFSPKYNGELNYYFFITAYIDYYTMVSNSIVANMIDNEVVKNILKE